MYYILIGRALSHFDYVGLNYRICIGKNIPEAKSTSDRPITINLTRRSDINSQTSLSLKGKYQIDHSKL